MNFSMLLLKALLVSYLRRVASNLFHSIKTDGKKEVLKKLCFKIRNFIRISKGIMHVSCGNDII